MNPAQEYKQLRYPRLINKIRELHDAGKTPTKIQTEIEILPLSEVKRIVHYYQVYKRNMRDKEKT